MRKSKIGLIKHIFFNNSFEKNDFSFKEEDFSLDQLRNEFFSLYQVLISNKSLWLKDDFVALYMYYLCNLLISYYRHDYVRSDLQKLKQVRKEIKALFREEFATKEQKSLNNFPDFIFDGLQTNILDYLASFISISELRKYIGNVNTKRSQFAYSRNLANYAIIPLQKNSISNFIQEINEILGNQYSFPEAINFLNASREAITDLGIVFYALCFFINLILMTKHIVQSAINEELSSKKVLKQEMEKRGFTMANDLVWATVGLLTTYNNFFHIASSVVSPIIVAFLTFDTLLFLAQWLFEASQYNEHLQELHAQYKDATVFEQAIIQRQIDFINDEWQAQCTYFAINILGANIIAASFAISMLCTGPLALAAFFSLLGNALYNASEEYKKYQKSKIAVRRELSNGEILKDEHHYELLKVLNEECSQNYSQFWKTLAFNVGGIAFIITAAAASWPVALGLTLVYLVYQLNDAYQKQLGKNNMEGTPHDLYRLLNLEQSEGLALGFSCD